MSAAFSARLATSLICSSVLGSCCPNTLIIMLSLNQFTNLDCAAYEIPQNSYGNGAEMTSTHLSSASALLLLLGGVLLLFAPATLLSVVSTDVPAASRWLAQLIGAGWLALAALNWLSRSSVLGGVYGRPVVAANLALYFISALVLI